MISLAIGMAGAQRFARIAARFLSSLKLDSWLRAKHKGLEKSTKHANAMADKIERGEPVAYGTDWGSASFYNEAQQALIVEILKKIKSGVITLD